MKVFDFEDYRKFIEAYLKSLPLEGRGELTKIAKHLEVNGSFLSQVLGGTKNLSPEQGYLLAEYLKLSPLETQYFYELISLGKTTRPRFQRFLKSRLFEIKKVAREKAGLPPLDQPLDEASQAIFYSSWQYTAIQLMTGIKDSQTVKTISQRLKVDEKVVKQILEFLTEAGLCTTDGERFQVGTRRTHLEHSSPLRPRHHQNWRLKGIEYMPKNEEGNLFFTAPMRIDEPTFRKIEKLLKEVIQSTNHSIDQAGDEMVACLNIDFFRF